MDQEIKMKLRDLISNDEACIKLGLNPYCINEGANGDDWIKVKTVDAWRWGVLKHPEW